MARVLWIVAALCWSMAAYHLWGPAAGWGIAGALFTFSALSAAAAARQENSKP